MSKPKTRTPSAAPEVKSGLYVKRPVVVEATQFRDGPPPNDDPMGVCRCGAYLEDGVVHPHVHTAEGAARIADGSWILRDALGAFYPVSDEVFTLTYEAAPTGSKVTEFGAHLSGEEAAARIDEALGS